MNPIDPKLDLPQSDEHAAWARWLESLDLAMPCSDSASPGEPFDPALMTLHTPETQPPNPLHVLLSEQYKELEAVKNRIRRILELAGRLRCSCCGSGAESLPLDVSEWSRIANLPDRSTTPSSLFPPLDVSTMHHTMPLTPRSYSSAPHQPSCTRQSCDGLCQRHGHVDSVYGLQMDVLTGCGSENNNNKDPSISSPPGAPDHRAAYPDSPELAQQDVETESPRVEEPGSAKFACKNKNCNGRGFSTFGNLLRHQREKHRQAARVACPACGAGFTRATALGNHLLLGRCRKHQGSS